MWHCEPAELLGKWGGWGGMEGFTFLEKESYVERIGTVTLYMVKLYGRSAFLVH